MKAKELLEEIAPDFLEVFQTIPAYGCISLKVHLHDSRLVRIEWSGTKSQKITADFQDSRIRGAR